MPALSETVRDELRANVRDIGAFQATDFAWRFEDVEFHPIVGLLPDTVPTAGRKPLLTCTHRDDSAMEFRVVGVQRGNSHEFDLVCEYAPALMFTSEVADLAGPHEIKRQMTQWLAVVARQLAAQPTMSRRIDELVEAIAEKLVGLDEPYSEPTRQQLKSRLGQLAALALVMRETAPENQRTSLTDAHRDARYLEENLSTIPRGRAARWIVGMVARVDHAWQLVSEEDDAHGVLQELWDAANLAGVLAEDYRTRGRLRT